MAINRVPTISPSDLFARQNQGVKIELLDVRTPVEYRAGHIPGAKLLSLDEISKESLAREVGQPNETEQTSIYLTCKGGFRAEQAVDKLRDSGYQDFVLVEGGTDSWEQSGLPLKRCGGVISLERQVQIVIGGILLLKVVFGFTLHEMFFLTGALIGAGLIMAGITRWCGMAKLIAMMPWNRNINCREKALV
ncbi:MAG: rhodanese-like domain-containing protein [Candidatus Thiodiazotropha sp. 'RUGA']|nr:rhodanese-like domain-containing protein [Candidatus Thiodiazotropha sp. 'RUGA']